MATPTYPSQRYYAAGTKKAANWGTAVALGANTGLLILGDTGLAKRQPFEPYPAIDQIIPQNGVLGLHEPTEITLPVNLQYEMGALGGLIAGLFGTAGVPANGGEANVYDHTFQWANSVTNIFTYAEERPGHVWECPTVMPYRWVVGVEGANITSSITLRGNKVIDDSAVNNDTQMDAITYVSRGTFLRLTQGAFWLNAENNGALDANDALEISDFEITYERSVDAVHVLGSSVIAEPREGEVPNVTLRVTLPRASNTNLEYFSTHEDTTPQKASLVFTGGIVSGGNNESYSFEFYFPKLMLINPPDVKMEPIIKNELTFAMLEASAAPTGMNYARPYVKVTNAANADYLA